MLLLAFTVTGSNASLRLRMQSSRLCELHRRSLSGLRGWARIMLEILELLELRVNVLRSSGVCDSAFNVWAIRVKTLRAHTS